VLWSLGARSQLVGFDMAMDPVESQYKPWAKDAMGGAKSIVVTGAGKTQCRSQTTRGRKDGMGKLRWLEKEEIPWANMAIAG
jgi:hypothetical protein